MGEIKIPNVPEDANLGFITKDSGKRQEFESGMVRDVSEGKTDYTLMFDGPISGFYLLHILRGSFNSDYILPMDILMLFSRWYESSDVLAAHNLLFNIAELEGGPYGYFRRCAELLTRGAVKYSPRNWMQAAGEEEQKRFKESALRHFMQYMCGDKDEDHAAAIWFNINGYEYVREKLVSDLEEQYKEYYKNAPSE